MRIEPELGDSVVGRRRMEIERGVRVEASLNMWTKGPNDPDGIEWESEGLRGVGGSYLLTDNHPMSF